MRSLFAAAPFVLLACSSRSRWVDSLPPDPSRPAPTASAQALSSAVMGAPPPIPAWLLQDGASLDAFGRAKLERPLRPAPDAPKVLRLALERTLTGEVGAGPLRAEILGAELSEGAVASTRLVLAAGACLTVGAHGGVGILETDLFVTKPGQRSELLGRDTTRGPGAIVGGRAGCLRNGGQTPLEVEVWVQARTGSGGVLVRLVTLAAP